MGNLSPKMEKSTAGLSVAGQPCSGQINVTSTSEKQGKQKSESSTHLLHSPLNVRMPVLTLCHITSYLSTTPRNASGYLQKKKKYTYINIWQNRWKGHDPGREVSTTGNLGCG